MESRYTCIGLPHGRERPSAVVTDFFCLDTSVLHTIASVQPDGVEAKGYPVAKSKSNYSTVRTAGRIFKPRGSAMNMKMPQGGETIH